jgi:hypothetical protein
MTEQQRVLDDLRAKLGGGDTSGVRISLHLMGGMPGERHLDQRLVIDGNRRARVRTSGDGPLETREASAEVSEDTVQELLAKVSDGLDGLVPRSEAGFLPDSLVGSIRVDVDGESTELFYLASEQDRIRQDKPISPAAQDVLDDLARLSARVLDEGA